MKFQNVQVAMSRITWSVGWRIKAARFRDALKRPTTKAKSSCPAKAFSRRQFQSVPSLRRSIKSGFRTICCLQSLSRCFAASRLEYPPSFSPRRSTPNLRQAITLVPEIHPTMRSCGAGSVSESGWASFFCLCLEQPLTRRAGKARMIDPHFETYKEP